MSDRIAELRALLAASTPGPWDADEEGYVRTMIGQDRYTVADCSFRYEEDAALICAAVNALPALLEIAEAARRVTESDDDCTALVDLGDALRKLEAP